MQYSKFILVIGVILSGSYAFGADLSGFDNFAKDMIRVYKASRVSGAMIDVDLERVFPEVQLGPRDKSGLGEPSTMMNQLLNAVERKQLYTRERGEKLLRAFTEALASKDRQQAADNFVKFFYQTAPDILGLPSRFSANALATQK